MTKRDDGGPAYPLNPDTNIDYKGNIYPESMGMSLRDWFAGRADVSAVKFEDLEAAASVLGLEPPDPSRAINMVKFAAMVNAYLRYIHADAMLVARKHTADNKDVAADDAQRQAFQNVADWLEYKAEKSQNCPSVGGAEANAKASSYQNAAACVRQWLCEQCGETSQ